MDSLVIYFIEDEFALVVLQVDSRVCQYQQQEHGCENTKGQARCTPLMN
jgi:hypothetical protein